MSHMFYLRRVFNHSLLLIERELVEGKRLLVTNEVKSLLVSILTPWASPLDWWAP